MKSNKKGVASVILRKAPNSIVTHCCSHYLNLSPAASCNLAVIDNLLEVYESITIHFNLSPKKDKLLEHIVITRCKSKIINETHPSINTFDEIFTKGWDSNSKKEATAYINALTLCLDVSPSVLRIVSRQMNRSNIPANTPEEYYRRVLDTPVLDAFITGMELRFNELNQRASTLLALIPSVITKPEYHGETMVDLIGLYRNDLPNPDIVHQELLLSKNKWSSTSADSRPSTLAESVKCDEIRLPNVFVLLKIGCTLPVTSCECERGFSAMRRLRNWLRENMKTDRLTSLPLMNIHHDIAVVYDEVARLFFQLHLRKIHQKT